MNMLVAWSVMPRLNSCVLRAVLFILALLHVYALGFGISGPSSRDRSDWSYRHDSFETYLTSGESAQSNRSNSPANPYFVNDSLVGQPVDCTPEEKECLRYNRIWFHQRQGCYPLGDGPNHCPFAVDRCVFQRNNHIVGTCAPENPCEETTHQLTLRMAYDGRCITQSNLKTICGEGPVNVVQHFFGDSECETPLGLSPPSPVYYSQPPEVRQCVFPNLRHDLTSVTNQETRVLIQQCSSKQSDCFDQMKVLCKDNDKCCKLFEKGPCSDDEWVTLNKTAWLEGTVEGGCTKKFSCGVNSRRMAFDGKCHGKTEILKVLCPGGILLPNVFGEMSCVTQHYYKHYVELARRNNGDCEVNHLLSYDCDSPGVILKTDCGLLGDGDCINYYE